MVRATCLSWDWIGRAIPTLTSTRSPSPLPPSVPPDLAVDYFGFENAINRAGKPSSLLIRVINRGGATTAPIQLHLVLPSGLQASNGITTQLLTGTMDSGDISSTTWKVESTQAGLTTSTLEFRFGGAASPSTATASLRFDQPLNLPQATYVPPAQSGRNHGADLYVLFSRLGHL